MSETKALQDILNKRYDDMTPLEYCLWGIYQNTPAHVKLAQAAAELEQLKASCDGWKNTAETAYKRVMELSAALDKKEALIVKLKDTLVLNENGRPIHLWDLMTQRDDLEQYCDKLRAELDALREALLDMVDLWEDNHATEKDPCRHVMSEDGDIDCPVCRAHAVLAEYPAHPETKEEK